MQSVTVATAATDAALQCLLMQLLILLLSLPY